MTQGIEYGENVEARSKLIQVFRYIQALNNLRNPPPKEIEEQQFVFWFHNLPNHPCIRRAAVVEPSTMLDENDYTDESGSDDFILKVSRPKLTEPPSPPREVISWLKDGWQNVDGKVIVESTRIVRMANGQTQTINFKDDPQRQRLLEEWKARRDKWVVAELPARRTMDLFERLYSLFAQFERESERLELMLGDGLLSWQPVPDKSIHHPVLLLHLQLRFDPEVPEFTLTETGQPSELYTAMLQTIPDIPVAAIGRCREDHAKNSWHPLGGTETSSFLKRMVSQISSQGTFVDQATVEKNPLTPYITRDPVIFVRPRTLGISIALEAILETLPLSKELAYSLTSLVLDSESNNKRDHESSSRPIDTPNGEVEHILLSKPANAEQLEIARRLERYGAVLVQGPPGTGKTHTIANLIGHLLAEGKSVLVTSEKPKALREDRETVAKPLQPP